jgi:hypothetical protein
MLGGIGIGLLSGVKNKKVVTIVGAIIIAIGIGGMIAVGSGAADILTTRGGFGSFDMAKSYLYGEEAFAFVLIAGLALMIFGFVSMQRKKPAMR